MIRGAALRGSLGLLLVALAGTARAGSPALERAQALFSENRWPQVREVLRAGDDSLAPEERPLAQLLIGRSLAREAEFYRAARGFANEVGLDYLHALAETKPAKLLWLQWFSGAYELALGHDEQADRELRKAAEDTRLPPPWRSSARLRQAVARYRLAPAQTRVLAGEHSHEGRFWRTVLPGFTPGEAPAAAPDSDAERLFAACALLRAGKRAEADVLLAATDLERPAVEDSSDPGKQLRFFDPLVLEALERIRWEQAAAALEPLGARADDPRSALATFYAAWSLYQLGQRDAARAKLAAFDAAPALAASLRERAQILQVALAPAGTRASPAQLGALWQQSQGDAENVLLWAELAPREWSGVEPLAGALPPRLEQLAVASAPPLDRASGGRWGLLALRPGGDPTPVLQRLSRLRDNASKNQIERNDPLLLLALAVANYRSAAYAQSLETLFALSQSFPGLRGLHWNLQGVYAARQTAGGETRISP